MSLYGDLPQAKQDAANADAKPTAAKGWASAAAKLQPRKSGAPLAPPAALLRAGRGGRHGGPPIVLGRGAGRGPPPSAIPAPAAAPDTPSTTGPTVVVAAPLMGPGGSLFAGPLGRALDNEYDPAAPNDYEAVVRERERRRREAEEEAERQRQLKEAEAELEARRKAMADAAAAVLAAARAPPGAQQPATTAEAASTSAAADLAAATASAAAAAAAAAAASASASVPADERDRRLKLSGEEAFLARGRGRQPPASAAPPMPMAPGSAPLPGLGGPTSGLGGGGGAGGVGVAQKLLQKMGWREGEGLGRNRQGISAPLIAQKTDTYAAVIVSADEPSGPADKRPKLQGATFSTPPSRVLALRNMVVPGEVDDDLEEEVGQELMKYGNVQDVAIFEVTQPGWPSAEAVRIFVKFDRVESATRALVDLTGRYFGGRLIRVAFFDEQRFEAAALEPWPGEFGEEKWQQGQ